MCISNPASTNYLIYRWNYTNSGRMKLKRVLMMRVVLNSRMLMGSTKSFAYECKILPNSRDFWSSCLKFKHVELSTLESEHTDLFIPNELLVGMKLHPLIEYLLFWEKVHKVTVSSYIRRSEVGFLQGFLHSIPI